MTAVAVRVEWEMGHRLPNHDGPCRNLHGHHYVAEIALEGPVLERLFDPAEGMVVDFVHVKRAARAEVAKLDHRFLLCEWDPLVPALREAPGVTTVPFVPTAENIAAALLRACAAAMRAVAPGVVVSSVRIHETPTAWAEARRDT